MRDVRVGSGLCAALATGLVVLFAAANALAAPACDDPAYLSSTFRCADGACPGIPSRGDVFPLVAPPDCDLTRLGVAIEDGGRFQRLYGDGVPAEARPSEMIDPVIAHLIEVIKAKAQAGNGKIRILIFAHGGLVTHESAMKEAQVAAPYIAQDGYVPVFLMWESGFLRTYTTSVCCVTDGEFQLVSKLPLEITRPGTDIATSAARAPETLEKQWLRFRSTLNPADAEYYLHRIDQKDFCSPVGSYYVNEPPRPPSDRNCPSLVLPGFRGDNTGDYLNGQKFYDPFGGSQIVYGVLTPPRWVLTYLFPEVGAQSWNEMLRQTRMSLAYAPSDGLAQPFSGAVVPAAPKPSPCADISAQADTDVGEPGVTPWSYKTAKERAPDGDGGFSIFFDRLSCELDQGDLKAYHGRLEIDFYGHSMGALIGNEIMSRYPKMPWGQVVYMAAASSIRDVRLSVAPALRWRNAQVTDDAHMEFYSLMLHPLAESQEQEGYGFPPQGSLLEWVDEMFERPRSVEDRTFGKWRNVRQTIRLFPGEVRPYMHFRVFARQKVARDQVEIEELSCAQPSPLNAATGGPNLPICNPTMHGDFTGMSYWRTAFISGCASKLQVDRNWRDPTLKCSIAEGDRP
jgi:hypothetical protein